MQDADPGRAADDRPTAVYATSGLVEVLLGLAADAEPREVSVRLAATPARDLDADPSLGVPPETPVFTDFYLPDAGSSVSKVFGMDLGVPAGQTHGRFVSHPQGGLEVSLTDDLHATMLVAVPPWGEESVGAFDRRGRRLDLLVVDAEPPERSLA